MVTVVNCRFVPCNRVVTRPSIFGNPFTHRPCGWGCLSKKNHATHVPTREEAILSFAEYWYADEQRGLRLMALEDFPPNATLGCVCHPKPCHADIIAGYINWRRNDL
jgi:Domain of unknown function (DUF4326)